MMVLDMSARLQAPLQVRFADLCHDFGKGSTPAEMLPRHHAHEERSVQLLREVCERWRVPVACRELAEVVAREHGNVHRAEQLNAKATVRLLERCDALRRPDRFEDLLLACECDARGRLGMEERPYPVAERLRRALQAMQAVDTASVAKQAAERGWSGPAVGDAIRRARITAVAQALGDREDEVVVDDDNGGAAPA
jgi:tRNA nucleotidyltransferase (CCA-adding enzyme)